MQTFSNNTLALDATDVFAKVSPSVVIIDVLNDKNENVALGSGVVIADGEVVTNCHVVQDGVSYKVRHLNQSYIAVLHYSDSDRDLCQLSVKGLESVAVNFNKSKNLKVGQRVYAVGAPKGFELTLSDGLISSLREFDGAQYIQTSAAISPGSSGGGLFDDLGELIGITTFYVSEGQNLNFALPVDWISELTKNSQLVPKKNNESGLDWFNRCIALEEKRDWLQLLKISKKWVKSDSNNAFAYYVLGIAYNQLGQYESAIKAYLNALAIQPEYPSALNNLGQVYGNLNQDEKALASYKRVLSIKPNDVNAWYNLGTIYTRLKHYNQAILALKSALEIDAEDVDAWNNLGINYYLQGEVGKVREVYLELKKLDPVRADNFFKKFVLP